MEILVKRASVTEIETPLLAVGLFEGTKKLDGEAATLDAALGGLLSQMVADGEISASLNDVAIVHTMGKLPARRVAVVGLGKPSKFDLDRVRRASGNLFKQARESRLNEFAVVVFGVGTEGLGTADCAQAIAEGAILAGYGHRQFKTMAAAPCEVERMILLPANAAVDEVEVGVRK